MSYPIDKDTPFPKFFNKNLENDSRLAMGEFPGESRPEKNREMVASLLKQTGDALHRLSLKHANFSDPAHILFISDPQVYLPGFMEIVLQAHVSPQLQTHRSTPALRLSLLFSAAREKTATAMIKTTKDIINALFILFHFPSFSTLGINTRGNGLSCAGGE
jgi:hypothetical protein